MVLEVPVACDTYLCLQHHTSVLSFKELTSPTTDVASMTAPLAESEPDKMFFSPLCHLLVLFTMSSLNYTQKLEMEKTPTLNSTLPAHSARRRLLCPAQVGNIPINKMFIASPGGLFSSLITHVWHVCMGELTRMVLSALPV